MSRSVPRPTRITAYPEVDDLLRLLLAGIRSVLGDELVGLYLYGSLVWGDFDPEVSDIDLLAALKTEVDARECDALKQMHDRFAERHPSWDDRIEVQYVSLLGLATFKHRTSRIAAISPGEPFELKDVGKHWLLNWYSVREKGVALYGPPPRSVITPISKDEFVQSVRDHARSWSEWVRDAHRRKAQAYAILTMCRALYACGFGEQLSKPRAAVWAQVELPEWAGLIEDALTWRKGEDTDGDETYGRTVEFVATVSGRIPRG